MTSLVIYAYQCALIFHRLMEPMKTMKISIQQTKMNSQ